MEFGGKTDIGKCRDLNEDSLLINKTDDYYLFVVADGMGGHLAGEVASKLAVDSINYYISQNFHSIDNKLDLINHALLYANSKIYEQSISDSRYANMGTTCDAAICIDDNVYIGHVGDSRVYLYDGKIKQITRDHSLVADLIESGSLTEEEAKNTRQKNIITRALGGDNKLIVDLHHVKIKSKDILLLCSDGLTNGIDDNRIKEVLEMKISPEEKSDMLIYMSNASGGYDNSTVVVAEKR
ncbi:Stp1/IreP family PP2C-type Ser/Thr phosphatase [Microaceticoccus formicicus]|uniref:Stp1/IreP family PP2C-type Ser/Thr phosphatase n=1 Tax=Microaceticoccus formicicus TaxID=3118105 RepID=UPI003CD03876|nr:Stp1/IreP family PP2C-type Ser/Thr phosphatase [Peptoniphilaceae bacterium AMB_02]